MKNLLVLLTTIIIFAGCGGSKPEPLSYPSWYFNPPKSDSMYLYGKGEGGSEKEAATAALNQIASTLSVSVRSSFESRKNVYQAGTAQSYTRSVSSDIKSSVEKITFNNYETVNMAQIGMKTVVAVRVDRGKLFDRKKKEYTSKKRKISDLYTLSKNKSIIEKLEILKNINRDKQEAISLLFLLNTLKSGYTIDKDLKTYESYETEEKAVRSRMKFYISADQGTRLLAEPIKVALNDKGLKVIDQNRNGRDIVRIILKGRDKKAEAMGRKIVKTTLNIALRTSKGNMLSSNKIVVVGRSSFDYDQAKEAASRSFAKEIKKTGIMKILGLEK